MAVPSTPGVAPAAAGSAVSRLPILEEWRCLEDTASLVGFRTLLTRYPTRWREALRRFARPIPRVGPYTTVAEVVGTAFDRRSLPATGASPGSVRAARSYARRLREQVPDLVLSGLDGRGLDRAERHLVQRGAAAGAASRMVVHLRGLATHVQALLGKGGPPLSRRRTSTVEEPGTSWGCGDVALVAREAPLHVRIAIALLLLPGGSLDSVAAVVKDDVLGVGVLVKLARGFEQVPEFCRADLGFLLPEIPPAASLVSARSPASPVSPRAVRRLLADWSIRVVGRRLRPSDVQALGKALRESTPQPDRAPIALLVAETWEQFGVLPVVPASGRRSSPSRRGKRLVVRSADPELARQLGMLKASLDGLSAQGGDVAAQVARLGPRLGAVEGWVRAQPDPVVGRDARTEARIRHLEAEVAELGRRLEQTVEGHEAPAVAASEPASPVSAPVDRVPGRCPTLGINEIASMFQAVTTFGELATNQDLPDLLQQFLEHEGSLGDR